MRNALLFFLFATFPLCANFIATHEAFDPYKENKDVVVIASTGRSGSTFLTDFIFSAANEKVVLKTHCYPLKTPFAGKILFIFSNPDKSAESALHLCLKEPLFEKEHFIHMEGSDLNFIKGSNKRSSQTAMCNLLAYDALGIEKHLKQWFSLKRAATVEEANVLAIKYEHLWDEETVTMLSMFLGIKDLSLPEKKARGQYALFPIEREARALYNKGSVEDPRYEAYEGAKALWESAPPFQLLKL